MFTACPKCHHVRSPADHSDPGVCPSCGLVFAKWIRRDSFVPPSARKGEAAQEDDASPSAITFLTQLPENLTATGWWGRVALAVLLAVWGARLAAMDVPNGEMASSFMHAILQPIHEAGHVLFMPFGEFLTIAGGSLFQLLLPLICAAAFLVRNHDPFGAAVGLWWCGSSFLDLAPYVHDAANPQLILLTGETGADGPHDWIYLLDRLGRVARSPIYGATFHGIGVVLMALALAWITVLLWKARLSHRRTAAKIRT